ncbi:MAG: hypothetical protein HOU81_02725 [Hamadaea sp.]|uniref:hypothetical protein n=1 Tax=Hamadaea sp. TaxID=2024425 RepID=UPI001840CB65|nr:hypothetical protein [Hamadaea sp.]NUR69709.1 hypothetical protein [Hamadaea sp.]NUT19577.1 hypothetical protein [Hamadaea sp.]
MRQVMRRLLAGVGSVMLPYAADDKLPKELAIARAIAVVPHPGGGVREWTYADATHAHGWWLVVLEEPRSVHVVEVCARTGDARVVTSRGSIPSQGGS